MIGACSRSRCQALVWTLFLLFHLSGCAGLRHHPSKPEAAPPPAALPKELNKVSLPPYRIEPPDILIINAQRLIPKPPYRIQPLDTLYIVAPGTSAVGTPEAEVINGLYPVGPEGTIDLGLTYGGTISVQDKTAPEAELAISEQLKRLFLKDPAVKVTLAQARGVVPIRGEHLVLSDGTVLLGTYGSVSVAGLTLAEARSAIESHLSETLVRPEVSVDVAAFNSKWVYVVTDFAGSGEQIARFSHVGGETVLDALAQIGGLSAVSSQRMWVARPAPDGCGDQILPVDYRAITRQGRVSTNYQLMPGDRLFIMSQPATKFDSYLGRVIAPFERVFGILLLGDSTIQNLGIGVQGLNGLGGVGGFGGIR